MDITTAATWTVQRMTRGARQSTVQHHAGAWCWSCPYGVYRLAPVAGHCTPIDQVIAHEGNRPTKARERREPAGDRTAQAGCQTDHTGARSWNIERSTR